ncbi:hypothetical protein [Brevibacillus parabrevis]|jgi:hypothetical protein|uniref:hypothetical protein n=1 Tax=Brevibacillus parabrevis TaxID=54914 RepID=UPI002490B135|nr:hypothetical protein [Brevibacillus parabrevis]
MGFSLVIGFLESLTSYYLVILLLVVGLILRFRYYVAYRNRQLTRDAAFAKGGRLPFADLVRNRACRPFHCYLNWP